MNREKPILSIVVPVFNVCDYVEYAIRSLIDQEEYPFEIILVDDGSTDGSEGICDRFAAEYPNTIHVIHKQNGGLPSARKSGVKEAQGEYVTFLDGDDWCSRDYYFKMVCAARERNADVVCSGFTFVDGTIKKEREQSECGFYSGASLLKLKSRFIYQKPYYSYGIFPSLCMKIIRRALLVENLFLVPNDITIAEDACCSFPVIFHCASVEIIRGNNGYFYRQHNASMIHQYDGNKEKKVKKALHFLQKRFDEIQNDDFSQIGIYFYQLAWEVLKNEAMTDWKTRKRNLDDFISGKYICSIDGSIRELPLKHRIFYWLLKRKMYDILTLLIRRGKWIKRKLV